MLAFLKSALARADGDRNVGDGGQLPILVIGLLRDRPCLCTLPSAGIRRFLRVGDAVLVFLRESEVAEAVMVTSPGMGDDLRTGIRNAHRVDVTRRLRTIKRRGRDRRR